MPGGAPVGFGGPGGGIFNPQPSVPGIILPGYNLEVLADLPLGYWRAGDASGNPKDSSGNGRHHTVTGGSPTYGVPALIDTTSDTAIALNGTNQYFTAPQAGLDMGDVGTWEIWVKRARTGVTEVLFDDGTNAATIGFDGANDKLFFNQNNVGNIVAASTAAVTDTLRHHIVVTKTGATVKIYLDDVDVTGAVTNKTLTNAATAKSIGASFDGASFWFAGTWDEAARYGTALSAARVHAHYLAGVATGRLVIATIDELVATTDLVARALTLGRTPADTVATSDAVARQATLARQAVDTVAASDAAAATKSLTRSAADTVATTDAASRTASLGRSAADTVATTDAVARQATLTRQAADTVAASDSASRRLIIARAIADLVATSDTVVRVLALLRGAADTVATSSVVSRLLALVRSPTDTVATTDAVVATKAGVITRTVADTVATTDAATRTGTFKRAAADTVATTDAPVQSRGLVRSASDLVATSAVVVQSRALVRSAADAVVTSDAAVRVGTFRRAAADLVATIESLVTLIVHGDLRGTVGATYAVANSSGASAELRDLTAIAYGPGSAVGAEAGATQGTVGTSVSIRESVEADLG